MKYNEVCAIATKTFISISTHDKICLFNTYLYIKFKFKGTKYAKTLMQGLYIRII